MTKIDLNNLDKSSWQSFKFEEIAFKISESVDPNKTDLGVYIGLEHIDAEDIHIRRTGIPNDVNGQKLKCYPGDVIFGKRRAYQRKAAIVEVEGICSAHAFVLRANKENIDPKLFPFFLHSDQFMHRMIDISVGGLSPTINWGDLKHQEFLLPPREEQKEIAELLWAMDDVIEKEKSILEKLKRIYLSKIEQQLINRNNKKIFFKDLGKVIRGVSYKPEDLLDFYTNEDCLILRSNNIFESNINYEDVKILSLKSVKKEQVLTDGDFAICMSNGSKELVGKSALYISTGKNVSIGSFCAGFRPSNIASRNLLEHLFASESYRQAIKRILTGSAINNLKPSDIEEMALRIEDNKLKLERLLLELKIISNNTIKLEEGIRKSQSLQKSIINQIF